MRLGKVKHTKQTGQTKKMKKKTKYWTKRQALKHINVTQKDMETRLKKFRKIVQRGLIKQRLLLAKLKLKAQIIKP